jgi:hypothetical protein
LGYLKHLNPPNEPTNGNAIHGFGNLNVDKLHKQEEMFDYALLQSSLVCIVEKHIIVHCVTNMKTTKVNNKRIGLSSNSKHEKHKNMNTKLKFKNMKYVRPKYKQFFCDKVRKH